MIVEIKISKAGTDSVVFQSFNLVDCGREEVAQAWVAEKIEEVCAYYLDQDDTNEVRALSLDNPIASRFGDDWQFYVEALIVTLDDMDIDPELDSIHDKYSLCL